jgi:hypothetical protein
MSAPVHRAAHTPAAAKLHRLEFSAILERLQLVQREQQAATTREPTVRNRTRPRHFVQRPLRVDARVPLQHLRQREKDTTRARGIWAPPAARSLTHTHGKGDPRRHDDETRCGLARPNERRLIARARTAPLLAGRQFQQDVSGVAGDLDERRDRLRGEQLLEEASDDGDRDRLVDVDNVRKPPGTGRPVGSPRRFCATREPTRASGLRSRRGRRS